MHSATPGGPDAAHGGKPEGWLPHALARTRDFAVIQLALDGTIVGWHGASRLLFGHAEQDILGQPFAVLFTPEDRDQGIPQLELDVALNSARSEDDRWHVRKSGSRFWGSGLLNKLISEDGQLQGFVKVVRDRTDLRTRYQTMQNRIDALLRQAAARDASLMTLVHELRNPLSPLAGAVELLRSQPPPHMLQDIAGMLERQVAVMSGLLDSVRPAAVADADFPNYELIVLQQALKPLIDGFQPQAAAKGVALRLIVANEPMVLEADPLRLHQMVSNLVSNALKYTPPGGNVAVSATIEGDLVAIRIEDDGIGIEKEHLESIFELFVRERVDDSVPGTGVGLAVVKRLASLHGGYVEVRSGGRGQGSRFTLQLPVRRAVRAPAGQPVPGGHA
jgi:PAS domain S-box-containing protein